MNDYEARLEERRERLRAGADKAAREAAERQGSADSSFDQMNGQPVLVGHHSEKRHRNQINRNWDNMRKAGKLRAKSAELERKADAVGSGGISFQDPEAVVKLREKLVSQEATLDHRKAINKAWRAAGKPVASDAGGWARVALALGVPEEDIRPERLSWARQPDYERQPYPAWNLSNLNANIRRVRKRIEDLKEQAEAPELPRIALTGEVAGVSYEVERDPEMRGGRVLWRFASRIPKELYQAMRSNGWRWMRTESAFSRLLNQASENSIKWTVQELERIAKGGHHDG